MEPKTYDFFGITPDGAPVWMCAVSGRGAALEKFNAIAGQCEKEIWVIQIALSEILASVSPIDGPRGESAHLDEFLAATIGRKDGGKERRGTAVRGGHG